MTSLLLLASQSAAWPLTAPEESQFQRTTSFNEAVAFMRRLQEASSVVRVRAIGKTPENRPILLAIASDPPVRSAKEARRQGKIVVYIQANIHAGEVEGKESALKLLRSLAKGEKSDLLRRMVLLVNPLYNADGNEKWGPVEKVRPDQDGPPLIGTRANAQGLDLNRDAIKAASPEMRTALAEIYRPWDPDIVMDLHTTNGTRHGYDLTWSPPTNPNTPGGILSYSQDDFLPRVRALLRQRHGMETMDYGNSAIRNGRTVWETFGHEGRYVTNYAGLRGQIGILSEATSYIPFPDRILATDRFLEAVLETAAADASRILQMRRSLPAPDQLAVEVKLRAGREEEILLEQLAPGEARPRIGRPKSLQRIKAPIFDRVEATRTVPRPWGYLVPGREERALALLRLHGVEMTRLTRPVRLEAEVFRISQRSQAAQPFQGVRLIRLKGDRVRASTTRGPGDWLVRTDQRLGALACHLLEPEGDDGATAWDVLRDPLTGDHPILRIMKEPRP